jgi:effector-binding domain-containing protein
LPYHVTIQRAAESPTAVVRANTTWIEFPSLWPRLLDEVWACISATPGAGRGGSNVMVYKTGLPHVEVAVEVGVEVAGSFQGSGRVIRSVLPGGEVATTVHSGEPTEIGAAYAAVREWCSARKRDLTGVAWEVYGHPDPQTGHFNVTVCIQLASSTVTPAKSTRGAC